MMDEVRQIVERGRVAINDGQECAAAFGNDGKARRRLHLPGRTDDDEAIRLFAPSLGALHRLDGHRLAERDVRRFQKTAAVIASRSGQFLAPRLVDMGRLVMLAALKAGNVAIGAMKLDQFCLGSAGELVQAVDVLSDQAEQLAALLKFADRVMSEIRLYRLEKLVGRFFELPMLHTRRFAGEKILKEHRLIFRPNAAGAAEVRHAGLRADAGAGEKDDRPRLSQPCCKFIELHALLTFNAIYFFCAGSAGCAGALGLAGAAGVEGSAGGGGAGCMSTTLISKTRVFPAIG